MTGEEAIEYAKENSALLIKLADPLEGFRDDVTPEEAEEMLGENLPSEYIIY